MGGGSGRRELSLAPRWGPDESLWHLVSIVRTTENTFPITLRDSDGERRAYVFERTFSPVGDTELSILASGGFAEAALWDWDSQNAMNRFVGAFIRTAARPVHLGGPAKGWHLYSVAKATDASAVLILRASDGSPREYRYRTEGVPTCAEFDRDTGIDQESRKALNEFVGTFVRMTAHPIHLGRPASADGMGVDRP